MAKEMDQAMSTSASAQSREGRIKLSQSQFNAVLSRHMAFRKSQHGGARANLKMADLSHLDMTLILVEQQVDRALDFADTVVMLDRGQVVHMGPAAEARDDHALMERHLGVALAA